jgi:hypothetical protein
MSPRHPLRGAVVLKEHLRVAGTTEEATRCRSLLLRVVSLTMIHGRIETPTTDTNINLVTFKMPRSDFWVAVGGATVSARTLFRGET